MKNNINKNVRNQSETTAEKCMRNNNDHKGLIPKEHDNYTAHN